MDTIEQIESQRNELARQIASVGEFRPGNLYENARKCGNPKCQCAIFLFGTNREQLTQRTDMRA